jgi:hypothetical protein
MEDSHNANLTSIVFSAKEKSKFESLFHILKNPSTNKLNFNKVLGILSSNTNY